MSRHPPTPKPPAGRLKLSGLLTTSGKILRSAVPIPGLDEFGTMAKLLSLNIQSTPDASSELRALGQKLKLVSRILDQLSSVDLENVKYYKSQFEVIRRIINETLSWSGTISRLRQAKDNLDVCEDLNRRLSDIIETAQLEMQGQMILSRKEDELAETIHPHRITNLSDYPDSHEPRHSGRLLDGPHTPSDNSSVIYTRRRGKLGTLFVHYDTYTSSSPGRARKARTQALEEMSQVSHNHIASVLGKTNGCGINGIVFAAGSMPIADYLKQGGLREAAKCVLEFHSVYNYLFKNTSFMLGVEQIDISESGSLLVIPRAVCRSGRDKLEKAMGALGGRIDPALELFIPYLTYLLGFGLFMGLQETQERFLNALATKRGYWNELKALELAKDLNLPTPDYYRAQLLSDAPPLVKAQACDIFSVNKHQTDRAAMHWIDSADSCFTRIQNELSSGRRWAVRGCLRDVSPKDGWISYALDPNHASVWFTHRPTEETLDKVWPSFVQAAKERAQPKAHLDDIYLCTRVTIRINISRLRLAETETLYFHRPEFPSAHPADFWGHFSTSSSVIPGVTQQEAKQRGWGVTHYMKMRFRGVKDDWGDCYESALQKTMDTTPGAFESEAVRTNAPKSSEMLEEVQGIDLPKVVTQTGAWYDFFRPMRSGLDLYAGTLEL